MNLLSEDDVSMHQDERLIGLTDETTESTDTENDALLPQPTSTSTSLLVLIGPALLTGIIIKAFDLAFLMTSYSRIASDLQHFKDASWIVLTDSICSAVFVPLYSYLLKVFGTRRMMLAAYSSFSLGLGLCAISTSFWQLLASRFAVGVGSSGITLLSMIVINDIVGMKQLAIWESFVTCIEMGISMAAGPLGAAMYRRFTWHSVFYSELFFAIIGIIILYFSFANIRSYPQHSQSALLKKGDSKVPRIDIEGWVLLILAVTIPIVALTLGNNFLDWSHPIEILLLVSGPIFMILFVLYEAKVAKDPVINMIPIFKIQYLRVLMQVFAVISIFNAINFVIPPYIQIRSFDEPSFEDWALTCVFLGFPAGAILGGYLVKADTFPVQRIMLTNAIVLQCLCVLFFTRIIKPESARYAPFLVAFGICVGIWQSCLLFATLSSTSKKWWPQTLALYYLIETFGCDLGIALMSSIMRSVAKAGIRSSLGNSDAIETIIVDAMRDLETVRLLDEKTRVVVLASFEQGVHIAFLSPCAMAAVVFILAASMNIWRGKTMHKGHAHTDHEEEDL